MTMTRYARIQNGVVSHVIDSIFDPDGTNGEWVACGTAGPGFQYNSTTGVFSAPAIPTAASRILTHLEFRRLFTQTERELIDELEVTFETNSAFSVIQKRTLRTGFKDFAMAKEVSLNDPSIPAVLALYVDIGLIAPTRPAEILA